MIQPSPAVSQLAASILKSRFSSLHPRKLSPSFLSPLFQVSNRRFSSPIQFKVFQNRPTVFPKRALSKRSIRYCSCQRVMCGTEADLPGGSMDVTKGRVLLPDNVKPLHYDLTLEPDFKKFTYEGTVVIEYVKLKI